MKSIQLVLLVSECVNEYNVRMRFWIAMVLAASIFGAGLVWPEAAEPPCCLSQKMCPMRNAEHEFGCHQHAAKAGQLSIKECKTAGIAIADSQPYTVEAGVRPMLIQGSEYLDFQIPVAVESHQLPIPDQPPRAIQ
jgi:hypothetical protein